MLVDDVTIRVKAGDGGRGAVAFQKVKMALGPTGGSGGHGGDVYFEGVSDLGALQSFRYKKEAVAANGQAGRSQFRDGDRGEPLIVKVPVGTVVHNLDTGVDREILKIGERFLMAKGGRGGRGNFLYRSSTNTSPKESQPGLVGDAFTVRLELRLIADVGLVGLPNVGKSSLLNSLTKASAKVANYPFTTLEPNLGVYYDLILADIPGLIEGASEGKGLGTKFLRHIARTRVLFHLVSAESADPVADYKTVRKELENYDPEFKQKREYIFLSKCDAVATDNKSAHLVRLRKVHERVTGISVIDEESLLQVRGVLDRVSADKRL